MNSAEKVLEVKALDISLRQAHTVNSIVKNISFSIASGETLALVGESGSGKSITALSILGLLPNPPLKITAGEIRFRLKNGSFTTLHQPQQKTLERIRSLEIGIIFQEPLSALNPVLTCGFQLSDILRKRLKLNASEAFYTCLKLFQEVLLPDPESVYRRYPHQLSGGQKQRVMIAMAIACNPQLLIADEPTTALDPTVQFEILQLLKSIQKKRGMGILIITHDLRMLYEFADTVMVMRHGACLEYGNINRVFKSPQHPYTKALLMCRPPLHSRPERLPVLQDFISTPAESEKSVSKLPLGVHSDKFKAQIDVADLVVKVPEKRFWYGGIKTYKTLINGVSFSLKPHETLGIIGESGCGKSTLARTLLQLMPAFAGQLTYKHIGESRTEQFNVLPSRKFIQLVFQDPFASLNPLMPVGEAIAEALRVHQMETNERLIKQRATFWLEAVGLHASSYLRLPHEFSGGQRQRVSIARALCINPKVLVCDESVSALDVSIQAQILNLINDLKSTLGFSCIFISHDIHVVRYMCESILVMKAGEIIESGATDTVLQNPQHAYTQALLQAVPTFEPF